MTTPSDRIPCAQAWRLIDAQEESSLPPKVAMALRKHLAGCPDCTMLYRQRTRDRAAIGAGLRARGRGVSAGSAGAWTGGSSAARRLDRRRRAAILFAMASFVIAAVSQVGGGWDFTPGMWIDPQSGAVWAGGELLEVTGAQHSLSRSDLIWTEADGSARIVGRSLELDLGPRTQALVISAAAQRVRIESGEATVRGAGRIETPRGVVVLDEGEALVRVGPGRLDVVALEGRVERLDARGRERIRPAGSLGSG